MEHRFPVEAELLSENRYVFVAVNHLDLAPNEKFEYQPSHIQPKEAKAIMAWAYGASLSMDVLERLSFVDTKRVCITGHSRTGKPPSVPLRRQAILLLWCQQFFASGAGNRHSDSQAAGISALSALYNFVVVQLFACDTLATLSPIFFTDLGTE